MLPIYVKPMSFITLERVHDMAHAGIEWMHPITNYLRIGEVLEDGKQI